MKLDDRIYSLMDKPLMDLLLEAQSVHRQHFEANTVEFAGITSIKTGRCPEDCKYCPQSGHYQADIPNENLMSLENLKTLVQTAKERGATRFCMGGAWRSPPEKAMPVLKEMIQLVKNAGLESCLTAGMLGAQQAKELKAAGLDYYNHNLDTSREYYPKIITTRTYDDRLETIKNVREANIHVCCGGILGLGETKIDRMAFIKELCSLNPPPESIPINLLMPIKGTPLEAQEAIDPFEVIRVIAVLRILAPQSVIRLSAGRNTLSPEAQMLCFLAGANSLWRGTGLLTQQNPSENKDDRLFNTLGMKPRIQAYVLEKKVSME